MKKVIYVRGGRVYSVDPEDMINRYQIVFELNKDGYLRSWERWAVDFETVQAEFRKTAAAEYPNDLVFIRSIIWMEKR